ncbi:LamB/YcsF family protein [Cytobacillus sp. S13-E01]|uniref:5-oxoprolinase subunit PxpA n=1 Tax=Cytobacillus sp. S13-E01 TaxID=3031326 RepID=UPI0023D896BA|nr:5-oxoprolinase subunit PxpA [Cytobacillus sp. S13-E01]MDF0726676.1 LamB/YcsF family protein [Cytobacillus sp. S13-E01]
MKSIDINCDLGESYGAFKIGNDELILDHVTSANIACAFHAGDPHVMQKTVKLAKEKKIAIGAHPGFQDVIGFGRRVIPNTPQEITDIVLYQLGALDAFCKANEVTLHHVKPHGALYNVAANERPIADAIVKAVKLFDRHLLLFGLSGSELIKAGNEAGLRTASEVFADRTYQQDGSLTSRQISGAVIEDIDTALNQVIQMIDTNTVTSIDGHTVALQADTICVHGDNEHALLFAQTLRQKLTDKGITIKPIG